VDPGVSVAGQEGDLFLALETAIERQDDTVTSVLEVLLNAGSDINKRGVLDITPLHIAAACGSFTVVQFLLDRGADPLAMDSEYVPGYPLAYVNKRKNPRVTALLTEAMKRQCDMAADTAPPT